MKKTFKLLGLFMGVVVIVSIAAVAIYALINNNKTYYIYDLRFVEPISDKSGFIYSDPKTEYVSVRNKQVYLSSDKENRVPIAIYAHTSAVNPPIEFSSSDESIATLVVENNKCFIEYYKVGEVEIKINIDTVTDTFKLSVFNQSIDEFYVYDEAYYGNFSKVDYFQNKIVAYSDGETYKYSYNALSTFDVVNNKMSIEDAVKQNVNSQYLRVDEEKINNNVFEFVYIEPESKKLVVKCKTGLTENSSEEIVIQSYTVSEEGKIKENPTPYIVYVEVVAYTPEFLQVELSSSPKFNENVIFMDTRKPLVEITEENIEDNIDNLTQLLDYEKAEKYLSQNGETATYNAFFTEKVPKIYLRFRVVYTNGDIVELTPALRDSVVDKHGYELSGDLTGLEVSQNGKYFEFDSTSTKSLTLRLKNFILDSSFNFEYKDLNEENESLFYTKDSETGYFTYTYWDSRTYYDTEICDAFGNIVRIGE